MKQINIAFITDRMLVGHGVDLVVDRIADGLGKIGYRCDVHCNYFDQTFTGRKSYKIKKLPNIEPSINPFIYERRIRKLVPYLNEKDIDLFIIQSFPFYSLIPKLKKPVLIVDHGIPTPSGFPLKRRLRFRYMQTSQNISYFKKAQRIITVSKYLLDCLPKRLQLKASFIYNGCDHYKEQEVPEEDIRGFREGLGVESDDILLLYVGRLNLSNQPYKGLSELITIFQKTSAQNRKIKLLAVGYGTKNDEEFLKNQGLLSIRNAPEELMPLFYSSCDICTTCSKWEGFDLPAAEAQSFGRPVICYDIGAHPEVVSDKKSGFVSISHQEFIDNINNLASNHDLRKKMGSFARQYSKKFSWQNSTASYDNEIRKLLNIKDYEIKPLDTEKATEKVRRQDVTVVIVNYNSSYSCLKDCIESIKNQTYKNIKIIIFDNNSKNDALDSIKNEYRDTKIIYSDKNLGYGEGLNQAIASADTEYILISNFDVTYDVDAVKEFITQINKLDKNYIGLAPKIKLSYQRDYIESVGIGLDRNLYIIYHGIGQLDFDQYEKEEDIFGVSFVSAFLKREAFSINSVGLIDKEFFLFYEDADFCYRANLFGYRFMSCPDAVCYHKYAYSFRDEATSFQNKYYYLKLNLLKTAYKNAETQNLKRVVINEISIQKNNLKDRNLKLVAKNILKNYKKSIRHLKKQRQNIQFLRQITDSEIIKYSYGEENYFNIVKNEPIYSLSNLYLTYKRLYAILGHRKYEEYVNYINNLEHTKFRIDIESLKRFLHNKMVYEPKKVHDFIDKINQ